MDATKTSRLLLVPEPAAAHPDDTPARTAGAPRIRRYRLARISGEGCSAPPPRGD